MSGTGPDPAAGFLPGEWDWIQESNNAVDVPGIQAEQPSIFETAWGKLRGIVSGTIDGVWTAAKTAAQEATSVVTHTGEAVGVAAGKTAAGALSPLLPIVVILLIAAAFAIKLSGIKIRV